MRGSNDATEESTAGVEPLVRDLRSIGHHARQVHADVVTLATEVHGAGDDLDRYLSDRVRRRPYVTLGAAAGIGYLLGGGLRSPLTAVLLGTAARVVAAQVVRELAGIPEPGNARGAYASRETASAGDPVA